MFDEAYVREEFGLNHSSISNLQENSNRAQTFKTSVDLFAARKPANKPFAIRSNPSISIQEGDPSPLDSPKYSLKNYDPTSKKLSVGNLNSINISLKEKVTNSQSQYTKQDHALAKVLNEDIPEYKGPSSIDFNAKGMGNGFISSSLRMPKLFKYANNGPGPGSYQVKGLADSKSNVADPYKKGTSAFAQSKMYPTGMSTQEKRPPVGTYNYSLDVIKKNLVNSCNYSFRSESLRDGGLRESQGPPPGTYNIAEGEARQNQKMYRHKSSFFTGPTQKKKTISDIGLQLGIDEQTRKKMQQVQVTHNETAKLHRSLEPIYRQTQELKQGTFSQSLSKSKNYQSLRTLGSMIAYNTTLETKSDLINEEDGTREWRQSKKFYV